MEIQIIKKIIIKHVHYFTITVDKVTSHNKELMALCIRFVDKRKNEFLLFSTFVHVTGEAIAS